MKAVLAPDPVPIIKDSVPVTHWVNVWMSDAGCLHLGGRNDSLEAARVKSDKDNRRICILKITTTVEIA